VLSKLREISPILERRAKSRYECMDPYGGDEKAYARSLVDLPEGCLKEITAVLQDILQVRLNGLKEREELLFDAQQNARIVANAEKYYRTLVTAEDLSWNIRDRHMMETLDLLLDRYGEDAKAIVWAHNTHIGDYRAT